MNLSLGTQTRGQDAAPLGGLLSDQRRWDAQALWVERFVQQRRTSDGAPTPDGDLALLGLVEKTAAQGGHEA